MPMTPRRSICLMLGFFFSLGSPPAGAEQSPNTLSEAERRAGWKLLFDGRSAAAFRNYRRDGLGNGWQVRDGAVVRATKGAGDIITRDQFGAFELQLEYRIAPGGDSGIMFHVTEEEPHPWQTGPEVQVLDNAEGRDPQKAGWLYQLYAPTVPDWVRKAEETAGRKPPEHLDATRPAGEWNHLYLRVAPGGGEVAVNGVVYERFVKGSKDWDDRVATSKFAAFPKFGQADRGHICLQDHGDEVAYRSLKVRELPADSGPIPFEDGTAAVAAVPAFPDATWEGWEPDATDGKPVIPLRPVVVTHAGDGSKRRFVLDQSGMIHVFKPGSVAGKLFLDLRPGTSPWAADVGQDLWEEIDIVTKGGNYGWSLREGTRLFGNRPAGAAALSDPVWEYDHQVGKSITGGFVYRGRTIPELVGAYLYGDFVSGRLWALRLDQATGKATNMKIPWSGLPIFGFGTDADGEAYVLTSSPTGQGVFRLAPAIKAAAR